MDEVNNLENIENKTLVELYELASEVGIKSANKYRKAELVNKIKEITGAEFPVEIAKERRTGESPKLVADITKADKVLGWKPESTLKDTIDSSIAWYNKHPKGWTS